METKCKMISEFSEKMGVVFNKNTVNMTKNKVHKYLLFKTLKSKGEVI